MDEDMSARRAADEQAMMDREAKALTRGCGMLALVVALVVVLLAAAFNRCGRTETVRVERDTVVVHDTIVDVRPQAKDSATIRYITRFLPISKRDTSSRVDHFREATQKVEHFADTSKMIPVEVPITSKHYGNKHYDAWVSGYEPSLDSIRVYKETQYITETITRTVKDKGKHFFLDVGAGCEYQFNGKTAVPFAELGARLKFGRVGIGAYGGYEHDTKENKGLPYARAKVTYDIVSF